jgi:hypothetical protein
MLLLWAATLAFSKAPLWPVSSAHLVTAALDGVVIGCLLMLARTWRRSLAVAASGVAVLDALISAAARSVEVAAGRSPGLLDLASVVLPLLIAVLLWSCRDRATRYLAAMATPKSWQTLTDSAAQPPA